jgi:hypothetical protein
LRRDATRRDATRRDATRNALIALLIGTALALDAAAFGAEAPGPEAFGLAATAVEDMTARTEFTKTFVVSADGLRATIADGAPWHYRDENGRLQDIEVVDEPDGDGRRYRRLPYDVRVDDRAITMGDRAGGWGLRFLWPEPAVCAEHTCALTVNGLAFRFRVGVLGVAIQSAEVAAPGRGRQV